MGDEWVLEIQGRKEEGKNISKPRMLEKSNDTITVHRFRQPVLERDVQRCDDDDEFIVSPEIPAQGQKVVGVSFFQLEDHVTEGPLSKNLHKWFLKNNPGSSCYTHNLFRGLSGSFPEKNMSYFQDIDFPLKPPKSKTAILHAKHFSLFPDQRMRFTDFEIKVGEFYESVCPYMQSTADMAGGSFDDSWSPPEAAPPPQAYMRRISKALYQYFTTSNDLNVAQYAAFFYYQISALNIRFDDILNDRVALALVADVMLAYKVQDEDDDECAPDCNHIVLLIKEKIPSYQPKTYDDSSSEDEITEGARKDSWTSQSSLTSSLKRLQLASPSTLHSKDLPNTFLAMHYRIESTLINKVEDYIRMEKRIEATTIEAFSIWVLVEGSERFDITLDGQTWSPDSWGHLSQLNEDEIDSLQGDMEELQINTDGLEEIVLNLDKEKVNKSVVLQSFKSKSQLCSGLCSSGARKGLPCRNRVLLPMSSGPYKDTYRCRHHQEP